jgi:anti-sigma B factor antagonist
VPEPSPSNIARHDVHDQTLGVEVVHRDDVVVVTVTGEIDLDTAPVLQAVLDNLAPDRHVIVDCADVHFIDSTGLQLIVSQLKRMSEAGGSLRLRHTSFPVRHVVEITGLIQLFEIDA